MADHVIYFCIDQFLRCGGALFGICGVVFVQQFELYLFPADGDAFGIQVFYRQNGAIGIIASIVRLAAGHGSDMA
jgi:hypothetical protein